MTKQHGRMIFESVENGPLIWLLIEENGMTRPKKYSELSATEAIQADCDIKAKISFSKDYSPEVCYWLAIICARNLGKNSTSHSEVTSLTNKKETDYTRSKNALAEVHNHDNVNNNMINQAVQAMPSSEQSNVDTLLEFAILLKTRCTVLSGLQLEPSSY
ncbi:hypothetical protein Tco_0255574 [Tanacetum coccineum]